MAIVSAVELTSDAFLVCISHALITEKEEVMGLLLGDIQRGGHGVIAHVVGCALLTRSDRRKDRVEISPEQLAAASSDAERLSEQLQRPVRVIGWYHSHPHITVHPSHIDVNTQAQYQMMDDCFIGLIFSCYNHDPARQKARIQVIAFQSVDLVKQQEQEAKKKAAVAAPQPEKQEIRTRHTGTIPAGLGADLSVGITMIEEREARKSESASPRQQERRTPVFQQTEVPIRVVPASARDLPAFTSLVQLQNTLLEEERVTFLRSLAGSTGSHPMMQLHSAAVYQKALCRIFEIGGAPLAQMLRERNTAVLENIARLEAEQNALLQELGKRGKS